MSADTFLPLLTDIWTMFDWNHDCQTQLSPCRSRCGSRSKWTSMRSLVPVSGSLARAPSTSRFVSLGFTFEPSRFRPTFPFCSRTNSSLRRLFQVTAFGSNFSAFFTISLFFSRRFDVATAHSDVGTSTFICWVVTGSVSRPFAGSPSGSGNLWDVRKWIFISISSTETDLHLRRGCWPPYGTDERFSRCYCPKGKFDNSNMGQKIMQNSIAMSNENRY